MPLYTAIVTLLAVLLYFFIGTQVGAARSKFNTLFGSCMPTTRTPVPAALPLTTGQCDTATSDKGCDASWVKKLPSGNPCVFVETAFKPFAAMSSAAAVVVP